MTKQEGISRVMRRIFGFSRGQIAVLYAGVAAALLGAIAMSTDVGVMYYQWLALQRGIDSAALAGVNSLPSAPAAAATTVQSYANSNGVTNAEISSILCIDDANASYSCAATGTQPAGFQPTKVKVTATRVVPYYFARALGLTNATLNVTSTAYLQPAPSCINCCVINCNASSPPGSPGGPSPNNVPVSGTASNCGTSTGQYNVIPIAVDSQTAGVWQNGHSYTLNRVSPNGNGPWPDAPGNWGNVTLCGGGNGGSGLRTQIANGYGGSMSALQTLQTDPGAKVGPINQGFADLLGASTDNYAGWKPNNGDPREVVVPLVNFAGCNGQCTVSITGFMSFYIDSYSSGAITGHFIKMVEPNSAKVVAATDAGLAGDPILIK